MRTSPAIASLAAVTASLILAGLAGTADGQMAFTDVSDAAGLSGPFFTSPTSHSLGVNWIDYDGDGWVDLFAVGGAPTRPCLLFRNRGDGTFESMPQLLPSLPDHEKTGSIFGDYDDDGDMDIYIYTDHSLFNPYAENPPDGPPNLLLRNLWVENGGRVIEGTPLFLEVAAAAGVDDVPAVPFGELTGFRSKSANWLDYDRDGCLDLFVSHIVVNADGEAPNRDRLYRNRCDGSFEDRSAALDPSADPSLYGAALASIAAHLDDDLWPDLYVVNISGVEGASHQDKIYRNRGDGSFEELTAGHPTIGDDAQAGMGIDVSDADNDGHWDVYLSDIYNTHFDAAPLGNVFYRGQAAGVSSSGTSVTGGAPFTDNVAPAWGVAGTDSWGVNFFDADLDGDEELFVSTMASAQDELFYRNDGASFVEISAQLGFTTGNSRGSATADFDRDGDLDLAVINQGGGLQLLRNDTVTTGRWLVLDLRGRASSTDAIGTVVELDAGGITRRRQIKGGSSAHSQDDLAVHFGIGAATTVDEIRIHWPSGHLQTLTAVAADQRLEVVEEALLLDGFESGDLSKWSVSAP